MKLKIDEPCDVDWNSMKIGLHSRHCEQCDKSVMDFTKSTRAEIIAYLLNNPNGSTCGRLLPHQFDFRHEDVPVLMQELKKSKYSNPFLIIALVCVTLSSCSDDSSDVLTGPESIEITQDTIQTHITDTVVVEPTNTDPIIDSSKIEVVEFLGDVAVVSGGICISEPNRTFENVVVNESQLSNEDDTLIETIYKFTEVSASFPGGIDQMMGFISENIEYPEYETNQGIQGNVYVEFVVQKDGTLTDFKILKSVEGSKSFDAEVIRVLSRMPKWTPAVQNKKVVASYMTLPFRFNLNN